MEDQRLCYCTDCGQRITISTFRKSAHDYNLDQIDFDVCETCREKRAAAHNVDNIAKDMRQEFNDFEKQMEIAASDGTFNPKVKDKINEN